MILYAMVFVYTTPWKECVAPMLECYRGAMTKGDVETAMWSICSYMYHGFHAGKPLAALESDYPIYVKQMKNLKLLTQHFATEIDMDVVQVLMGRPPQSEEDPNFRLPRAAQRLAEVRGKSNECLVRCGQLNLAVHFGDDAYAADVVVDIAEHGMAASESTLNYHVLIFQSALVCYTTARATGRSKRYLKLAKKHHQTIKTWVKAGNANFVFAEHLLTAEALLCETSGRSKMEQAVSSYKAAVAHAEEHGFVPYQALCLGRWGNAEAAVANNYGKAHSCYEASLALYESWGAKAVCDQLRQRLETSSKQHPILEQASATLTVCA